MKVIKNGATRWVILIGNIAVKFPRPTHWESFLNGLLANIQEVKFYSAARGHLCPIIWHSWGGFVVLMPKVSPLSCSDWGENFRLEKSSGYHKWVEDFLAIYKFYPPVEPKKDSFGWLNNQIVAVDYGS